MFRRDTFRRPLFGKKLLTVISATVLLGGCSDESATTPEAAAPAAADASALDAAIAAMGMENLSTITWSGTAWRIRNGFMQTPNASPPWPLRDTITNYTRTLDLNQPASRATGDTFAQNLFFAPAVAGTYTQNVAAGQTAWGQQMEIWLTPWGFLKGAELNNATESMTTLDGDAVTAVTWKSPTSQVSPSGMQYTVTGYINADNQVQQVETWVEDPFMGDMHVVAVYDDYKDMGGLMVPGTMEQQRGGGGVFGVTVASATANPPNAAELLTIPPPATSSGAPPAAPATPPAELTQQVGEGVYLITGGYVALAVEFSDHIAVFEAGQPEMRGQQIIDEVKRVIPGKPIRYLINSHPHSDHTGGMVPFIREGATVITHENNVEFLDMALSTPRTLLGQPTLDPQFRGVNGVTVLEDDTMRLELHHIENGHSDGTLVAYLPEQRILMQADFTLPVAGAEPNPFVVNLAEYVDANNLDFDQYLAVHAAEPQTKAQLMATIGK
jgi:glyoxylase-like metal-dependent hydrolase (beta-lactamase superfamily II)